MKNELKEKAIYFLLKQVVFIIILLVLIFTFKNIINSIKKVVINNYNIEQKRKEQQTESNIKGISVYEKKTIIEYLNNKYPNNNFEIVSLLEKSGLSIDKSRVQKAPEKAPIIDMKEILIRPNNNKEEEFIVKFEYKISDLEMLRLLSKDLLYTLDNQVMEQEIPYYFGEKLTDNYKEEETKKIEKEINEQIKKNILKLTSEVLENIEYKIFVDYLYPSGTISINIKSLEDFLNVLNSKKDCLGIDIFIVINEDINELSKRKIKMYYKKSEKISNRIINEFDVFNYSYEIKFISVNDKKFRELDNMKILDEFDLNLYEEIEYMTKYTKEDRNKTKYKEFIKEIIYGDR